jgi:hypothetical protein
MEQPSQQKQTTLIHGVPSSQLRQIQHDLFNLVKKQQQESPSTMTVVNTMNTLVSIAQRNGLNTRVIMVFLEQIIAGPDGILGTDDDLLPASIVMAIKSLFNMDANLVEELLDFMFDVAEKTCASWWTCCLGCR